MTIDKEALELAAEAIYAAMADATQTPMNGRLPPHWVPGGNSTMQDRARKAARFAAGVFAEAARTPSGRAGEGWVMVPIEATDKMVLEGNTIGDYPWDGKRAARVFKAMLAAAPNPPVSDKKEG